VVIYTLRATSTGAAHNCCGEGAGVGVALGVALAAGAEVATCDEGAMLAGWLPAAVAPPDGDGTVVGA
jgi:hypothetical protein